MSLQTTIGSLRGTVHQAAPSEYQARAARRTAMPAWIALATRLPSRLTVEEVGSVRPTRARATADLPEGTNRHRSVVSITVHPSANARHHNYRRTCATVTAAPILRMPGDQSRHTSSSPAVIIKTDSEARQRRLATRVDDEVGMIARGVARTIIKSSTMAAATMIESQAHLDQRAGAREGLVEAAVEERDAIVEVTFDRCIESLCWLPVALGSQRVIRVCFLISV